MRPVAHTGENRNAYGILVGKPEGKNRLVALGVGLKVLLQWILHGRAWPGLIWFMRYTVGGICWMR